MDLIHYSSKPFCFFPEYKYQNGGAYKPAGFWVSVKGDQDWQEWCHAEDFNIDSLRFAYQVTLKSTAKVLVITTLKEMDAFHKRFYLLYYIINEKPFYNIDWNAVKKEADALIIAPYRWDRRMEFMWYYGWDCASGVIWNLNEIATIQQEV